MSERKLIREYSEITIRFEIDSDRSQFYLNTAMNLIDQNLGYVNDINLKYTLTKAELKREYGPAEDE